MANSLIRNIERKAEQFVPSSLADFSGKGHAQPAALWGSVGVALVALGMRRRGMIGGVMAAAGSASVYKALDQWWRGRRARRQTFGKATVVIERSVSDVFRFCRRLGNMRSILPRAIMPLGAGTSQAPDFESQLMHIRENELLVWRTVQALFEHVGRIELHPARYGQATSVELSLQRLPEAPPPEVSMQQQVEESLRRLKAVLEAPAGAAAAEIPKAQDVVETGWAPESGEPRVGFSRGEAWSTAGNDVGWAPESGDRIADSGALDQSLPETERIEETAQDYRVTEGSEESFPASDAPSWTPGRA